MPTVSVYAPFGGSIPGGRSCYCMGGWHSPCNGSDPFDISKASGTSVLFRLSSAGLGYVRSIVTTRDLNQCCGVDGSLLGTIGTPVKRVVQVDMFSLPGGGGSYIGTVFYGHLSNPIPNDTYDLSTTTKLIGSVVAKSGSCNADDQGDCWDCYRSNHVHMEQANGFMHSAIDSYCTTPDCTLTNGSSTPVTTGTIIYQFTF
jgi:hypothetical protein